MFESEIILGHRIPVVVKIICIFLIFTNLSHLKCDIKKSQHGYQNVLFSTHSSSTALAFCVSIKEFDTQTLFLFLNLCGIKVV